MYKVYKTGEFLEVITGFYCYDLEKVDSFLRSKAINWDSLDVENYKYWIFIRTDGSLLYGIPYDDRKDRDYIFSCIFDNDNFSYKLDNRRYIRLLEKNLDEYFNKSRG